MPSMVESVPVGAIVRSCEFLRPYLRTSSLVFSDVFASKNGVDMISSVLHFANGPFSFASSAEAAIAESAMANPILSHILTASSSP